MKSELKDEKYRNSGHKVSHKPKRSMQNLSEILPYILSNLVHNPKVSEFEANKPEVFYNLGPEQIIR